MLYLKIFFLLTILLLTITNQELLSQTILYTMPAEDELHEGTWLQWPHQYEYGTTYRNRLDATWVAMTRQLEQNEKVHIIAYNTTEQNRIINLLNTAGVPLTNVDFKIFQTNDVWVRDNGPIYVSNSSGQLRIEDWNFNGWGFNTGYVKDNVIPALVGTATDMTVVNLNSTMTIEGGSYTIDGNGVLLATKSSILNSNRNPGMTQAQAEAILKTNLGVTKFIWLNGVAGLEITDMHIDGFAMFADSNTIVTMNNSDLLYWEVPQSDINTLYAASKINGTPYNFVNLPLTQNNVITTYGLNLGYKGSYVNFYIANSKILVPFYNDPNDNVAKNILQALYPGRTVVGIDVRNLYENGGMVHCVTQQQPAAIPSFGLLNMSVIIEGFYNDVLNNMRLSDTIKIYLRNSTSPYSKVDSSIAVINANTFSGSFQIQNALTGNYYITTKHRNSLETWSGTTVGYTQGGTIAYNFISSATQAFGNNMIQVDVSPVKFGVYSGDINQDGNINLVDAIPVYNDASVFITGYKITDVNGDNLTDLSDIIITKNNSSNFVIVVRP